MPWPGPPVQVARTLPPSSWTGCFAQQTCFGTWGCCRPVLASLSWPHPQDTWCSAQPPPLMLWTLSMVNVWYKLSTGILSLPGYEGGWCGGPLREGLIVNFPRHPPPCWNKWGWIYISWLASPITFNKDFPIIDKDLETQQRTLMHNRSIEVLKKQGIASANIPNNSTDNSLYTSDFEQLLENMNSMIKSLFSDFWRGWIS